MFSLFFCSSYLKKKNKLNFFGYAIRFNSKSSKKKIVLNNKIKKTMVTTKLSVYKKKNFFFKYDRVVCKKSRWVYNSKNFRNVLHLRNCIHQYFDGVFSNSFFKKELEKKITFLDFIRHSFVKPEFRLDVLLWRLNFFSSPYSARIAIVKNQVCINNVFVKFSYFLKQGDVVVVNTSLNLNYLHSLKLTKFSLNPFVEVDYYSNTFIVLQDYSSMSVDTFPCIIRQPFKVSAFLSYLKLK
jgi:ribosomal protein S4